MKKLADPFILGLLIMILLGYLMPGLDHVLYLGWVIDIGVVLIFFFYGLKLNLSSLRSDISNWRLHVGVQAVTYLLYPSLVMIGYPFMVATDYFALWLGMFYLASLPSTVSSSIVMVSMAKGNIPGAIFNASLSGLIGVLITPFLMGIFLTSSTAGQIDFAGVVLDLCMKILLPLGVGISLNKLIGSYFQKYSSQLAWFDKVIIWLIVYRSFSDSFTSGIFSQFGVEKVLVLFGVIVVLFFVILSLSGKVADWLHFSIEDKITLMFCGTKKSLVHGSVMASVIFAGMESGGVFLLPILLYHPFQIFVVSIIAQRYGARDKSSR